MSEHCGCVLKANGLEVETYIDRTNCRWSAPLEPHEAVRPIFCSAVYPDGPGVHSHKCSRFYDHTNEMPHVCECGMEWK